MEEKKEKSGLNKERKDDSEVQVVSKMQMEKIKIDRIG